MYRYAIIKSKQKRKRVGLKQIMCYSNTNSNTPTLNLHMDLQWKSDRMSEKEQILN